MKIRISQDLCKGHQACVRAAPKLFLIAENGFSRLLLGEEVPQEMEETALLAYENCPEFAIQIF
jgi:ferredoxin